MLYGMVRNLLPNETEIFEDYRNESLRFGNDGRPLELDIFVPSLSMALEYQGAQHFHSKPFFGSRLNYERKDREKRDLCKRFGISLIEVRYFWGDSDNLLDFLGERRPDVFWNGKRLGLS
eukprot:TRINITY_DN2506_c0_g1_i1.p1 TRINITY_DN2506_c0_g1~~TRINITY_DN2506_c0_g1_i1.p1  ORF type:complete len:120 (-),score=17.04 TRINITY_DN2506_c0_g1_i1:181-540(-)